MSPSAIPSENVSELVDSGVKHTIAHTAPSLTPNGAPTALAELDASKLIFTRNPKPRPVPEPNSAEILTQNSCTDHMIRCTWTSTTGWHSPTLSAYGPLTLMPTASVLHYATTCFEGMKLYRGHDGLLRLFRPSLNCARMLTSATRISLPAFPPAELLNLIKALVRVDAAKWLPKSRPGTFFYLRPTMIGSGAALGVQVPKEATLFVIAVLFPSFDEAFTHSIPPPIHQFPCNNTTTPPSPPKKPGLRLLASPASTVRAWPGGFGSAKLGANYGPTLLASAEAKLRGYDHILWLLGPDAQVTEAGASNFFVVWETSRGVIEMVTAGLGEKVILDGVTRRSVLELVGGRLRGEVEVVERGARMGEVVSGVGEGRLLEAFVCGTAYFITPVSEIHFRGKDLEIPMSEGDGGKYTALVKTWLKDIMYGKEKHEWGVVVEEEEEEDETPADA